MGRENIRDQPVLSIEERVQIYKDIAQVRLKTIFCSYTKQTELKSASNPGFRLTLAIVIELTSRYQPHYKT